MNVLSPRATATLPVVPLLLALALLAPAAARADDQSFASTAGEQARTLVSAELAVTAALQRVDRRGRSAIPAARRKVKLVRRQLTLMARAVRAEQTSTPEGETVKRALIRLLADEKRGYGTLDGALAAFKRGRQRTASTLLARAGRQLRATAAEASELAGELARLAATPG